MKTLFICLFASVLLLPLSFAGEQTPEPLKHISEVLTAEAFRASGLDKLNDKEIKTLSGHLFGWEEKKRTSEETEKKVTKAQEDEFGSERIESRQKEKQDSVPDTIRSRIPGEFNGWDGHTRFQLENGQVWKQTDGKSFYVRLQDPEVEITKGWFGAYYLSVEGYGSRCKVERVK